MKYIVWSLYLMMILLRPGLAAAQQDHVWVFGSKAGLDFNSGSPVPIMSAINSIEACASVCDRSGNLLFYTEGSYVWNRNHDTMPNGHDLTALYPSGQSSTASSVQGTVIVPVPGDQNRYYVFSLSAWTSGPPPGTPGKLYYSIVDMSLNGGLGDVVAGSNGIYMGNGFSEEMTAVAGDRCNIWLLMHANSGHIHAFEISNGGLNLEPVVSAFPAPSLAGQFLLVSPGGNRLVTVNGLIRVADFDAATGMVSNLVTIPGYMAYSYTAAISPDNTKLYAFDMLSGGICQFDISSDDPATILASKVEVANSSAGGLVSLKLAPDGKIYFQGTSESSHGDTVFSRIAAPDMSGTACQFEPDILTLLTGSRMQLNLPNEVPYINMDTLPGIVQAIAGPCFANINATTLQAANDTTGWDYTWSTGDVGASLPVSVSGTYWVGYHMPPCTYRVDTFNVSFSNGVLPAIHIDTACIGTRNGRAYTSTYPADTVQYSYAWLRGADTISLTDTLRAVASGNYSVLIHTAHCDTSLSFTIPEVAYRVSFIVSDTLVCMGDLITVQNTSDNHFSDFIWYFGASDSSISATPQGHIYPHPGSYEVMLTGGGSLCKDTARQVVVADSLFPVTFDMDQSAICVGDGIHFNLADADSTLAGLQWDWGEGSYLHASYAVSFYHAFDRPGLWRVEVTQKARVCPDVFFSDTVRVYPLPKVDLGPDTSLCLDGHAVVLRNLATTPNETHHYLWNNGDTTAGLRVLQPGSYSLQVTTAPLGCNATGIVEVTKDCYANIPNAFTPNGDGDNDYFFPRTSLSKSISDFRMRVFSRWGQLVFETVVIDGRGWDGRFNNAEQPLGVYLYLIDVVYANGRQEHYKGNVTLVR